MEALTFWSDPALMIFRECTDCFTVMTAFQEARKITVLESQEWRTCCMIKTSPAYIHNVILQSEESRLSSSYLLPISRPGQDHSESMNRYRTRLESIEPWIVPRLAISSHRMGQMRRQMDSMIMERRGMMRGASKTAVAPTLVFIIDSKTIRIVTTAICDHQLSCGKVILSFIPRNQVLVTTSTGSVLKSLVGRAAFICGSTKFTEF